MVVVKLVERREGEMKDNSNLARFLLTFFLGAIGSIIINRTSLKPNGWKSRSWCYFLLGLVTLGIYELVASVCNLVFDPQKESNIGYRKDETVEVEISEKIG